MERHYPLQAIVFTKADKVSKQKISQLTNKYMSTLKTQWEVLPAFFVTSTVNGLGREQLLEYIESINMQIRNNSI